MKYLFIFLILFVTGCANTTPSVSITETTKKEIEYTQKEIKNLKCDTQAKETLQKRLEVFKSNVENISLACETEKEVYKQQINKLKIFITVLMLCLLILLYKGFKKWI